LKNKHPSFIDFCSQQRVITKIGIGARRYFSTGVEGGWKASNTILNGLKHLQNIHNCHIFSRYYPWYTGASFIFTNCRYSSTQNSCQLNGEKKNISGPQKYVKKENIWIKKDTAV
jgi:hypothetical protein